MALLLLAGCRPVTEQPPPTPEAMVLIPAGEALVGTDDPDADEERRPLHTVSLPAFFMDRGTFAGAAAGPQ